MIPWCQLELSSKSYDLTVRNTANRAQLRLKAGKGRHELFLCPDAIAPLKPSLSPLVWGRTRLVSPHFKKSMKHTNRIKTKPRQDYYPALPSVPVLALCKHQEQRSSSEFLASLWWKKCCSSDLGQIPAIAKGGGKKKSMLVSSSTRLKKTSTFHTNNY